MEEMIHTNVKSFEAGLCGVRRVPYTTIPLKLYIPKMIHIGLGIILDTIIKFASFIEQRVLILTHNEYGSIVKPKTYKRKPLDNDKYNSTPGKGDRHCCRAG